MTSHQRMSKAILDQLGGLMLALQRSTAHPHLETALTTGERIAVNQQRTALFRALDGQHSGFTQSPDVETKITRILYLIERTGWVPKD